MGKQDIQVTPSSLRMRATYSTLFMRRLRQLTKAPNSTPVACFGSPNRYHSDMSDSQQCRSTKTCAGIALTLCVSLATAGDPCTKRFDDSELRTAEVAEIEGWPLEPDAEYTVASIRIVRQQIFNTEDAAENRPMFRLANRWHVNTKESTIRTLLLFGDGDKVDVSRVAETERALRAKRFPLRRARDRETACAEMTSTSWS